MKAIVIFLSLSCFGAALTGESESTRTEATITVNQDSLLEAQQRDYFNRLTEIRKVVNLIHQRSEVVLNGFNLQQTALFDTTEFDGADSLEVRIKLKLSAKQTTRQWKSLREMLRLTKAHVDTASFLLKRILRR